MNCFMYDLRGDQKYPYKTDFHMKIAQKKKRKGKPDSETLTSTSREPPGFELGI